MRTEPVELIEPATGNGRLRELVRETRPLSRRRDLEDLHAADARVSRCPACGSWRWDSSCATCSS